MGYLHALAASVSRYCKRKHLPTDGTVPGVEYNEYRGFHDPRAFQPTAPHGGPQPRDYLGRLPEDYDPHPGFPNSQAAEYEAYHSDIGSRPTPPERFASPPTIPCSERADVDYDDLPMTHGLFSQAMQEVAGNQMPVVPADNPFQQTQDAFRDQMDLVNSQSAAMQEQCAAMQDMMQMAAPIDQLGSLADSGIQTESLCDDMGDSLDMTSPPSGLDEMVLGPTASPLVAPLYSDDSPVDQMSLEQAVQFGESMSADGYAPAEFGGLEAIVDSDDTSAYDAYQVPGPVMEQMEGPCPEPLPQAEQPYEDPMQQMMRPFMM